MKITTVRQYMYLVRSLAKEARQEDCTAFGAVHAYHNDYVAKGNKPVTQKMLQKFIDDVAAAMAREAR